MIESDLYHHHAAEHHGQHHGTGVPDAPSKDGNNDSSESKHEDDKHSHHKEEKQKTERNAMRNRLAPILTALSIVLLLGLTSDARALDARLQLNNLGGLALELKDAKLVNLDALKLNDGALQLLNSLES